MHPTRGERPRLRKAQEAGACRSVIENSNAEGDSMPTPVKKIALVTGANKGIGRAIAAQLAKTGMTVLLGARNVAAGEETAAQLRKENLDVQFLQLDQVQPATIEAAAASIASRFRRLDVLVNNAAIVDPADGPPGTADLNSRSEEHTSELQSL